MDIQFINKSHHPLPQYQTSGSAGMDIFAYLEQPLALKPMERMLVPTGLYMAIPKGYEAQIRPRSGLAVKQGLTCLNTPGTIDSDFRGEIKVLLINLSNSEQIIQDGDRIAQMIIAPYIKANCLVVETLDETERGSGGFGSTGL